MLTRLKQGVEKVCKNGVCAAKDAAKTAQIATQGAVTAVDKYKNPINDSKKSVNLVPTLIGYTHLNINKNDSLYSTLLNNRIHEDKDLNDQYLFLHKNPLGSTYKITGYDANSNEFILNSEKSINNDNKNIFYI